MSTENVIRIFSELRRENIINGEGREVHILDMKHLELISKVS